MSSLQAFQSSRKQTKKIASMRLWKDLWLHTKMPGSPWKIYLKRFHRGFFTPSIFFVLKRCHRATVKDKVGKLTMIWLLTPRPLYIARVLSSNIVESFPTIFAKGDDGRTSSCHRLQPISCLPHWWLLPLQRLLETWAANTTEWTAKWTAFSHHLEKVEMFTVLEGFSQANTHKPFNGDFRKSCSSPNFSPFIGLIPDK